MLVCVSRLTTPKVWGMGAYVRIWCAFKQPDAYSFPLILPVHRWKLFFRAANPPILLGLRSTEPRCAALAPRSISLVSQLSVAALVPKARNHNHQGAAGTLLDLHGVAAEGAVACTGSGRRPQAATAAVMLPHGSAGNLSLHTISPIHNRGLAPPWPFFE